MSGRTISSRMANNSISETTRHLDALAISNVESEAQHIKTEQLTDPENQDDFQLAALRLVEQNRIAVQNNAALLSNEHYEELDGVTEGQFEYRCSLKNALHRFYCSVRDNIVLDH